MRALRKVAVVGIIAMSSLAAECFEITDPFVVAVNVKDIKNTYNVAPGTVNFDPGCITKNPADYIDANFNVAGGGQLVDVIVQTNGAFAGDINNGQVRIGGELWSARAYDETSVIPEGSRVDVFQIKGATALVHRIPELDA